MSNPQDLGYSPDPLLSVWTACSTCSLHTMLLRPFATAGNWRTISRVVAEVRVIVTTAAAQWGQALQFACQLTTITALGFRSRKTQRANEKLPEVFANHGFALLRALVPCLRTLKDSAGRTTYPTSIEATVCMPIGNALLTPNGCHCSLVH